MAKRRMQKDECCCGDEKYRHHRWHHRSMCGGIYGLGFIGAAIYYISQATGFWVGVLGVLKAIVWPAFLVYQALRYLGA